MASVPRTTKKKPVIYPTSDGRPMAETDQHRDQMVDLIESLKIRYKPHRKVYVSGNLVLYYVEGDKRKHLSPDVFLVKGILNHPRDYYLLWEERKSPNVVFEIASKSTRNEDLTQKFEIYRDILRVSEYFLFDPFGEYLQPSLKGFRLRNGQYVPIRPVNGRLPSKVLGLHLERVGVELRLYDPATGEYVPTPRELLAQTEAARQQAEEAQREEAAAREKAETELERLRRELEALRTRSSPGT